VVTPALIDLVAGIAVAGIAVPIELRTGHIPNWLTLGGLIAAVVLMTVERRFDLHILGLLAGSVPAVVIYSRDWIGGGSVKLVAASSMLAGPWVAVGALLGLMTAYLPARLRDAQEEEAPGSPWILAGVLAAACVLFVLHGNAR
jgi:Flp pilus assembly protein protease CpaA